MYNHVNMKASFGETLKLHVVVVASKSGRSCQFVGKVTVSYPKAAKGKACFNHFNLKAKAGS